MFCLLHDDLPGTRPLSRVAALLTLLLASGCGAEPTSASEAPSAGDGDPRARSARFQQQGVDPASDAGAPVVASVDATGSGCPEGTWTSEITSDQTTVSVYFDAFGARVADGTRAAEMGCDLRIRLRSPSGLTYGVTQILYNGSVDLEEGVTAYHATRYFFDGGTTEPTSKQTRKQFPGPASQGYSIADEVSTDAVVWSPCSGEHDLRVSTLVGLIKNQDVGEGTITVTNLDGVARGQVLMKLTSRPCDRTSGRADL